MRCGGSLSIDFAHRRFTEDDGTPCGTRVTCTFFGGKTWAYSHSIVHFACVNGDNTKLDLILRVTDGYDNFGGKWLISHEHISVPVDLAPGKADLQSKP